jgi:tetratricopeptide (TPR) repeat protein
MESAEAELRAAEGDIEGALTRFESLLENSGKNSLAYLKWDLGEVSLLYARVLCALAAKQNGSAREALLARADKALKNTFGLPKRFLYACGLRQRAVIELLRGRVKSALAPLDQAMLLFEDIGGKVEEAAARLLRARVRDELGLPGAPEMRAKGLSLLQEANALDPAVREGDAWSWR